MKKKFLFFAFSLAAVFGCMKDSYLEEPVDILPVETSSVFSCDVQDLSEPGTRSHYISGSFDDAKVTSLTVAVYDHSSGVLHLKKHFSSGFNSMDIKLRNGNVYDLYAIANMGDQTANIPDSRNSLLSDFVYSVPSYSSVNTNGIPMSGKIESFTAGTSTGKTFNLKRLFAKVTLNVTTSFNGGTTNGVKVTNLSVGNANGKLTVFGQSRMGSSADKISSDDYIENSSVNASNIVFYVPENRQGNIGSAVSSRYKNPDNNSAVAAKKDILTYVDVTVTANSTYYSGTVDYRAYVGENATTNFDVKGNYKYVWNMTLTEDGLIYDDWKIDRNIVDGRYLEFIKDPVLVESGDQVLWSDILETNLLWGDIAKSYTGTTIYQSEPTSTGFTVKGGLAVNTVMTASFSAAHNSLSALEDDTRFRIVTRDIAFDRDVYEVAPRKNVLSQVTYSNSYSGAEVGLGGFSAGSGVKWTVTPPAGLPHSASASQDKLDYSYNGSNDKVTWTPTSIAPPGDYTITCQTVDGRHDDSAILRVLDTRWINTDNAYDGRSREFTVSKGDITSNTIWKIGYAYGDMSVSDDTDRSSDSDNAYMYIGSDISGTWSNHVGYFLDDVAVDYLSLYSTSVSYHEVRYRVSQSIPVGDYKFNIFWKNTWDSSLQDYTLKDYAVLHVTGVPVTSITIPSTMRVNIGLDTSISATVYPSNASVKAVRWEVVSGTDKASIASSGNLAATISGLVKGTAQVRAYATDGSGVASNICTVSVVNDVDHITVTPSTATVEFKCTQQYTAIATYKDGTTEDVTSLCTWSSSNGNIATVDSEGLATASENTAGTARITATYTVDGTSHTDYGEIKVTAPELTSISLSSSYKYILVGQELDITPIVVTLHYSNGEEHTTTIGDSDVTVTHATGSHTSISGKKVTGLTYGVDKYTVKYGNKSVYLNLAVSQIEITPASASIDVGGTQEYSASLKNYNGTTVTGGVTFTWSSGDSSIATISGTTTSPTATRTATGVSNGTVDIIASYSGAYGTGSASVQLTVNDSIISTTTETETNTEYRNLNLDDTSEDTDYTASVKINNKTSETVDCGSHTVTVTKSGTHTHTVYSNVQPQKRTGTRTRTKYTWASGNVTYDPWSDWTWGAWTNNGSVVTTQKSRQTGINDASSMTISGFTSWFTSSGSVSANSTTSARTATLRVTNGTASASATLTQEGQTVVTEHELVLTGSAVTTKVGKTVTASAAAKYYTITYTNGVETGRTYVNVTAQLYSNNTGIATATGTNGTSIKGIAQGTTYLYGKYAGIQNTYASNIPVTVNAGSGWGVDDDNDPGSGSGEGGDYKNNGN